MIEFKIYGDSAILVNFTQKIDLSINSEVLALASAIENAGIAGLLYCTPAYCSITVGYDPMQLEYGLLTGLIKTIYEKKGTDGENKSHRKLLIPVCYAPPHALDLEELETQLDISQKEIIRAHTHVSFHVYMLGFLPGFAYMGTLPKHLVCRRKKTPRLSVPAQSVGLAGQQTGIYPLEAPGGWQIIGRTPLAVFNPKDENPFLFKAGDEVQFYAISNSDFEKIENDIVKGHYNFQNIYDHH